MDDIWKIGGREFTSRFFIGSAQYPSPDILRQAVKASGAQVITVSLRREAGGQKAGSSFWQLIKDMDVHILPNTAGSRTVAEAVTTAEMAREIFKTNWIKLEVIGDDYTLQPDVFKLVEATHQLIEKGFTVFPYTTDDLIVAQELISAGCDILMPWGAPIGSGKGLNNPFALKTLRARCPQVQLIVDAGLGAPSHAAHAMELGFDGVLLNTAVAKAGDSIGMANAFGKSIEAGRTAFLSGIIPKQDMANPSTPVIGTPFWHGEK
jgi:thiazole synthase